MDRREFISLPAIAIAAGSPPAVRRVNYTHPKIFKQSGVLIGRPNETTTIKRGNGDLLALSTPREGFTPVCIEVRDYHSGQLIASPAWSGMFGNFVEDPVTGVIHAWGASAGSGTGNSLMHSVLDADFNPSAPDVVHQWPSYDRVWNTSVCAAPGGGWIMALETLYPATLPATRGFHIVFWRAESLNGPWTPFVSDFNYNSNAPYQILFDAFCPTLKLGADGKVYMFYMTTFGANPIYYSTCVARSATMLGSSWEFSSQVVIAGDGPGQGESVNASDFDFAEDGGACWGTYFAGDQATYIPVKRCMYRGTEQQFLSEFF